MRICGRHWNMLRADIRGRGLDHLVADSGRQALANTVSEMTKPTIGNFDPLMAANNDLWAHGMDMVGLAVMMPNEDGSERCPVCYSAEMHAATCPDEPCPDPTFDKWIGIAAGHAQEEYERRLLETVPDA